MAIHDYNRSMSPLLQRFLFGVMVVSGIIFALILTYALLVYMGVLPQPTF